MATPTARPRSPRRAMPTGILTALVVVLVLDLAASAGGPAWMEWVAKPVLMPLVAAWVLVVAERPLPSPVRRLLAGIGLAWLGDLLLLPGGDGWFLAGLLAFLAMQVAYLAAFRAVPGRGLLRQAPWWVLPYLAVWVGMNAWLNDGVDDLFVPVLVYSAVLVAMAASALDRSPLLPRPHGAQLATGGALFVVSDGTLAAAAFGGVDDGSATAVLVMTTYVAAQLLIAAGVTLGTARSAPPGVVGP